MDIALGTVWSAAGVLGGFQIAALTLRINREIDVGSKNDLTRLPVADCFNLLSLTTSFIGVFVLPILDVIGRHAASRMFGLAAVLLLGWAFALAGHYEMYNWTTKRSYDPFPRQERIAASVVAVAVVAYVVIAIVN
jgi:hypothetical protein